MSECPEFEDKEIPDDCYDCELYIDGECASQKYGKVGAEMPECPYGEDWDNPIPETCEDCEYYDGYKCFHPKKE